MMSYRHLILIWCGQFILSNANSMPSHHHEFEIKQLKQRILSGLGLKRIPDVSRASHSQQELDRMIEVYRRSISEEEEVDENWTPETTVKRFYSFKDNAARSGLTDSFRLNFPVNIRNEEDAKRMSVQSAKLYIYKRNGEPSYEGQSRTTENVKSATVKLYQLMEPYKREDSNRLLIEARNVEFGEDGWEMFDVSKAIATWIERRSPNYGFQLQCENCECRKLSIITADTASNDSDNRARLDTWIAESSYTPKRSTDLSSRAISNCTQSGCCMYSMVVSFDDIGWNWVQQPKSFEAYFCKGGCSQHNYASTHAMIQTLYSQNESIPPACCVPKRLTKLNILHYNDEDPPELVVSEQAGMIVRQCGCS